MPLLIKTKVLQLLKFLSTRTLIIYILFILGLFYGIDFNHAQTNWLNSWKRLAQPEIKIVEQGTITPNTKNLPHGLRYFQKLRDLNPREDLFRGGLGACYFAKKEFTLAIKSYQQAINLEPNLYFYPMDLGMIYYYQGLFPEATQALTQSLRCFQNFNAFCDRARKTLSPSQQDLGLPILIRTETRAQTDVQIVYETLANIYSLSVDPLIDSSILEEGLRAFPASPNLLFAQGLKNLRDQSFSQAIEYFSKAITQAPSSIEYYYFRGMAYKASGREDLAAQDAQRISWLTAQGVTPRNRLNRDIRLHFNLDMISLKYLLSY